MNMREKIARAIQKANGDLGEFLGFTWQDYLPYADAVLEAMREPTDEMIVHSWNEFDGTPHNYYNTMIDAAREGK